MEPAHKIADELYALPSYLEVPMLGLVPINAYLLRGRNSMLVDTGTAADSVAFLRSLREVIDPKDLKWIWLTHPDADHTGSLHALLKEVPHLKVITTFLGFGIMGLSKPLPLDRVYFLNPGEQMDLGDRTITALQPPTFDNPATTGCLDSKTGAFFSADCFGAVLSKPAQEAGAISEADLHEGQLLWEAIDHPWVHKVDRSRFAGELERLRQLAPRYLLSGHLPPAEGMLDRFLDTIAAAPDAAPYVGPNQAALEQLLAQLSASNAPDDGEPTA